MQELVRTNNAVLITAIEALLKAADIPHAVLDQHMSVLEGSLGMLQRRIVVDNDDHASARQLLEEAGLAHELRSMLGPARDDTTDDAVLGGRLRLLQKRKGHRVGHDAILLAAGALVRSGDRICELGAGVGAAGLAVAIRHPDVHVTMLEIDPGLADLASQNAARNGLGDRVTALCVDATAGAENELIAPLIGTLDGVIMNPPFNDASVHQASPDAARRVAHSDPGSTLEQWVAAADRLLHSAGRVTLIWRADGLDNVLATLRPSFGHVRVIPIYGRAGQSAIRVVVSAMKGGRGPLRLEPGLVLNDRANRPTSEAEAILRHARGIQVASD